jgi:hypothetical protein
MVIRGKLRPGTSYWSRAARMLSVCALIGLLVVVVFRLRACSTEKVHNQVHDERSLSEFTPGVEVPTAVPESAATTARRNSSTVEDDGRGSPAAVETRVEPIDWKLVGESSPIPRGMPANESDDPYSAGFAREWVEQSLKSRTAFFGREAGSPLLDPKPLLLDVVSEPKNPEDSWPYGVEYELRRIVEQQSQAGSEPAVTRTFCNRHGCLIYLEFEGDKMSDISSIPNAILKSSWRKGFGIEPRNVFVLLGRQDEPRIKWQLFLIHRHPPK